MPQVIIVPIQFDKFPDYLDLNHQPSDPKSNMYKQST
jgi:hypothetical protein